MQSLYIIFTIYVYNELRCNDHYCPCLYIYIVPILWWHTLVQNIIIICIYFSYSLQLIKISGAKKEHFNWYFVQSCLSDWGVMYCLQRYVSTICVGWQVHYHYSRRDVDQFSSRYPKKCSNCLRQRSDWNTNNNNL